MTVLPSMGPMLKAPAPPPPSSITVLGTSSKTIASNSIVLTQPSGVAAGDIGVIAARGLGTVSAPAGWTALRNIWYKIYTGAQGSVTLTSTASGNHCASIIVLRGVSPVSPIPTSSTRSVFTGTSLLSTAITSTHDNMLALSVARASTASGTPTLTYPSGSWSGQVKTQLGVFSVGMTVLTDVDNTVSTGAPTWTSAVSVSSATNELFLFTLAT